MLKFNNVDDIKEYLIDIDEYIPFSVNFGEGIYETICFRFGDGSNSLLEISMDRNTLKISNITLVSVKINNVFLCDKERLEDEQLIVIGFPIFQYIDLLEDDKISYIDNFEYNIELFIGNHYLYLNMNKNKTLKYIQNDNIFFGFDVFENLNSISIRDIPFGDMEIVRKSIS